MKKKIVIVGGILASLLIVISFVSASTTITDTRIDLEHISTQADDHAFEIDFDAGGFGDANAVDIIYTTGAISAGIDAGVFLINVDESLAAGGIVFGMEILSTEGSATIYGMGAGALVGPIHQNSGTFVDMDSANNSGTDNRAEFISTASNVTIFASDNDYIIIGDADKFEELEFLLDTIASGAGIKPTIEYSTGVGTWTEFTPIDGTHGMRNNGIIAWDKEDIPSWATGVDSEYLIRITRTQNSISTVPVEFKVQIAALIEYKWDKDGNLVVNEINASLIKLNQINILANTTGITCNAANEGAIYYDGGMKKHYGCNSTDWGALY